MSEILKNLSAPALVAAIKANLFEWYRYLGRSPKTEFYDSPALTWLLTGIPDSFLNVVLRTHLEPDKVDATIKETLAHFRSRGVTTFSWWTEPGTQPTDLAEHLLARGLAYTNGGPGMAVDLLALNEDLTTPTNLTIHPVDDTEALRGWSYASMIGFGVHETYVDNWFDLFVSLGFNLPLRSYLGRLNGKPVAASQLFLGVGVVGIYVVATVPDARRQGIGLAMTLAPLRDARAMGYRIGILHSSPKGLGVYQKLRFQEYCKMSHYVWASEAGQQ